jgi:hypothetical protein
MPDNFRNALPKPQVLELLTIICLVAHFRATRSASDRKVSGRRTVLYDVTVKHNQLFLV